MIPSPDVSALPLLSILLLLLVLPFLPLPAPVLVGGQVPSINRTFWYGVYPPTADGFYQIRGFTLDQPRHHLVLTDYFSDTYNSPGIVFCNLTNGQVLNRTVAVGRPWSVAVNANGTAVYTFESYNNYTYTIGSVTIDGVYGTPIPVNPYANMYNTPDLAIDPVTGTYIMILGAVNDGSLRLVRVNQTTGATLQSFPIGNVSTPGGLTVRGVTVDGQRRVYVTTSNGVIVFSSNGTVLSTIPSTAFPSGSFLYDVTLDKALNVYLSVGTGDFEQSFVHVFSPSPSHTLLYHTSGPSGTFIHMIWCLKVDDDGFVYVLDGTGNIIVLNPVLLLPPVLTSSSSSSLPTPLSSSSSSSPVMSSSSGARSSVNATIGYVNVVSARCSGYAVDVDVFSDGDIAVLLYNATIDSGCIVIVDEQHGNLTIIDASSISATLIPGPVLTAGFSAASWFSAFTVSLSVSNGDSWTGRGLVLCSQNVGGTRDNRLVNYTGGVLMLSDKGVFLRYVVLPSMSFPSFAMVDPSTAFRVLVTQAASNELLLVTVDELTGIVQPLTVQKVAVGNPQAGLALDRSTGFSTGFVVSLQNGTLTYLNSSGQLTGRGLTVNLYPVVTRCATDTVGRVYAMQHDATFIAHLTVFDKQGTVAYTYTQPQQTAVLPAMVAFDHLTQQPLIVNRGTTTDTVVKLAPLPPPTLLSSSSSSSSTGSSSTLISSSASSSSSSLQDPRVSSPGTGDLVLSAPSSSSPQSSSVARAPSSSSSSYSPSSSSVTNGSLSPPSSSLSTAVSLSSSSSNHSTNSTHHPALITLGSVLQEDGSGQRLGTVVGVASVNSTTGAFALLSGPSDSSQSSGRISFMYPNGTEASPSVSALTGLPSTVQSYASPSNLNVTALLVEPVTGHLVLVYSQAVLVVTQQGQYVAFALQYSSSAPFANLVAAHVDSNGHLFLVQGPGFDSPDNPNDLVAPALFVLTASHLVPVAVLSLFDAAGTPFRPLGVTADPAGTGVAVSADDGCIYFLDSSYTVLSARTVDTTSMPQWPAVGDTALLPYTLAVLPSGALAALAVRVIDPPEQLTYAVQLCVIDIQSAALLALTGQLVELVNASASAVWSIPLAYVPSTGSLLLPAGINSLSPGVQLFTIPPTTSPASGSSSSSPSSSSSSLSSSSSSSVHSSSSSHISGPDVVSVSDSGGSRQCGSVLLSFVTTVLVLLSTTVLKGR